MGKREFLLVLGALALAGCGTLELTPVARFPGRTPGAWCTCAAVASDGFVALVGQELLHITSRSVATLGTVPAEGWTAISGDGRFLAREYGGVRLLDRATGRETTLSGYRNGAVALAANGSAIAYSDSMRITVRSLPDLAPLATFSLSRSTELAFSPDADRIAVRALELSEVLVFDLATKACVLHQRRLSSIPGLSFSADGKRVAVPDGVFDLEDPRARSLENLDGTFTAGGSMEVDSWPCAVARDRRLYVHLARTGEVEIRDPLRASANVVCPPLAGSLYLLLLSRGDDLLLVGAADTLAVHDARTGDVLEVVRPPASEILNIEYRGNRLALEHRDAATVFVERKDGSTTSIDCRQRGGPMPWPIQVRASTDGRFRTSSVGCEAYGVLEVRTSRILWSAGSEGGDMRFAFSPDSSLLAAGTGSVLRFHDVATGDVVGECSKLGSPITTVTFSPDGSELACGCEDGSVVILAVPSR